MTPEEREKERQLFENERKRAPHLFERSPMVDTDVFLRWIGIELPETHRPIGYLRYMPHDFIVEEISSDRTVHTVDVGGLIRDIKEDGPTFYADLVKIGVSTFEAVSRLAEILGIHQKQIGYAGLKDRLALTSQYISIRGVQDAAIFQSIAEDNFFLKNIVRGKGALANGELWGNRFTITIRAQRQFSAEETQRIQEKAAEIAHSGFWNFFSFQRFGTPRLISHWLGLLLAKGRYDEVIKIFLTYAAPRELHYFRNIRRELENVWGDWDAMLANVARFPSHFQIERILLEHLSSHPADFLGALHAIPDQVRLWLYAYDSFLFNRTLSQCIKKGEVPFELPFATSFNPRDIEPYREFLAADGVELPSRFYKDFPFVRVRSRTCPTLQGVEVHTVAFLDDVALFNFSLPKGSYATSFLMNFCTLASGMPMVSGISKKDIDAKSAINMGSLTETLDRFRAVLEQRERDISWGEKENSS